MGQGQNSSPQDSKFALSFFVLNLNLKDESCTTQNWEMTIDVSFQHAQPALFLPSNRLEFWDVGGSVLERSVLGRYVIVPLLLPLEKVHVSVGVCKGSGGKFASWSVL